MGFENKAVSFLPGIIHSNIDFANGINCFVDGICAKQSLVPFFVAVLTLQC